MKILIIVESKHQGNTLKVAEAMAQSAPITITDTQNIQSYNLHDYDIVGFGSGIYAGRHDNRIIKLADSLCDKIAYSFVFSTSGGTDFAKNNKVLIDLLKSKNKIVLGTFSCKGLDKFFFLKLFGGINKGSPNDQDLKNSQDFILEIIKKYNEMEEK